MSTGVQRSDDGPEARQSRFYVLDQEARTEHDLVPGFGSEEATIEGGELPSSEVFSFKDLRRVRRLRGGFGEAARCAEGDE